MKRKISFLEFCIDLKGKVFVDHLGQVVPKYILYWKGYETEKLLFNRSDVKCHSRKYFK